MAQPSSHLPSTGSEGEQGEAGSQDVRPAHQAGDLERERVTTLIWD